MDSLKKNLRLRFFFPPFKIFKPLFQFLSFTENDLKNIRKPFILFKHVDLFFLAYNVKRMKEKKEKYLTRKTSARGLLIELL